MGRGVTRAYRVGGLVSGVWKLWETGHDLTQV